MRQTNDTAVLKWIAIALFGASGALVAAEYFELVESTKAFVPAVSMLVGGFLAAARAEWSDARPDDSEEQ